MTGPGPRIANARFSSRGRRFGPHRPADRPARPLCPPGAATPVRPRTARLPPRCGLSRHLQSHPPLAPASKAEEGRPAFLRAPARLPVPEAGIGCPCGHGPPAEPECEAAVAGAFDCGPGDAPDADPGSDAAPSALQRPPLLQSLTPEEKQRDRDRVAFCGSLAAFALGVDPQSLDGPERAGSAAQLARHVALYLVHVALSVSQNRVALASSRRRATVVRACAAVEDLRDDPGFDEWMDELEEGARAVDLALEPEG